MTPDLPRIDSFRDVQRTADGTWTATHIDSGRVITADSVRRLQLRRVLCAVPMTSAEVWVCRRLGCLRRALLPRMARTPIQGVAVTEEELEIAKKIAKKHRIEIGKLLTQILIDDYEREIMKAFGVTPPKHGRVEVLERLIHMYPQEARKS